MEFKPLLSSFLIIFSLENILPTSAMMRSTGVVQLQSNMWRESREAVVKADPRTLYGKDRHCVEPEPPEAYELPHHNNSTWSSLFSRYTLDAGDELDVWLENQENYNETANEKHEDSPLDILIPVCFPVFFALFLMISAALIPFIGAATFQVVMMIWWMITHEEIRRCGRRFLITNEVIFRKRQRILMPDNVKNPPKSRFHLPHFFRLHPEEDIPAELEQSEDDDWDESESEEEDKDKKPEEGASLSGLNTDTTEFEEELESASITKTDLNQDGILSVESGNAAGGGGDLGQEKIVHK